MLVVCVQPPRYPGLAHEGETRISIKGQSAALLKKAADRRGCSPDDLLSRVIRAVVDDDLFNAVLDDE
jgi:hypothetical protein